MDKQRTYEFEDIKDVDVSGCYSVHTLGAKPTYGTTNTNRVL